MSGRASLWVIRDDVPRGGCTCGGRLLRGEHSSWCEFVRRPGGVYYAGRDLEGHWWMPGAENAARFAYRVAQRMRRELWSPRPLRLERAP